MSIGAARLPKEQGYLGEPGGDQTIACRKRCRMHQIGRDQHGARRKSGKGLDRNLRHGAGIDHHMVVGREPILRARSQAGARRGSHAPSPATFPVVTRWTRENLSRVMMLPKETLPRTSSAKPGASGSVDMIERFGADSARSTRTTRVALRRQRAREPERGIGRADIARRADHGDPPARLTDIAQGLRELLDRHADGRSGLRGFGGLAAPERIQDRHCRRRNRRALRRRRGADHPGSGARPRPGTRSQ